MLLAAGCWLLSRWLLGSGHPFLSILTPRRRAVASWAAGRARAAGTLAWAGRSPARPCHAAWEPAYARSAQAQAPATRRAGSRPRRHGEKAEMSRPHRPGACQGAQSACSSIKKPGRRSRHACAPIGPPKPPHLHPCSSAMLNFEPAR